MSKIITILLADDDGDDRVLIGEAFDECGLRCDLRFAQDGEDLMDYLNRSRCGDPQAPWPDLILLDLNMPRKDGIEALTEIKADPGLRATPVVMLTTSAAERDISRAYDRGVNSYCVKPVTFDRLVEMVRSLSSFWLETAELPYA